MTTDAGRRRVPGRRVDGAELRDAESVLAQLSDWIEDDKTRAPHSALGMHSPADYRAETTLSSSR